MRRRRFLRAGTAIGTLGLAGCFGFGGGGGGSNPPPRKAEVYDTITTTDGDIVVELMADPRVESRTAAQNSLALPVGRAAAQKGGRGSGATGRGSGGWGGAPKRGGRAIYHGDDDDDDWREDRRDEISWYGAAISVVGLGYMGTKSQYSDDPPPAGPLSEWDQRWTDAQADQRLSMDVGRPGWYRVGTRLTHENGDQNFGWESVDFRVDPAGDGYDVENPWQVSPRL